MRDKEMLVKDAQSDERVFFHLRLIGDSLELFDQHGRRFGSVIEHQTTAKNNNVIECVVRFELSSPESTLTRRRHACKNITFAYPWEDKEKLTNE